MHRRSQRWFWIPIPGKIQAVSQVLQNDIYRGKIIFSRNEDTGKYNPSYIEKETGESFGIDRPLTIIEKNKNVKGRDKQKELDMDIKINVGQVNKLQLVICENLPLEDSEYAFKITLNPFEYKTFKVYDPEFWSVII